MAVINYDYLEFPIFNHFIGLGEFLTYLKNFVNLFVLYIFI